MVAAVLLAAVAAGRGRAYIDIAFTDRIVDAPFGRSLPLSSRWWLPGAGVPMPPGVRRWACWSGTARVGFRPCVAAPRLRVAPAGWLPLPKPPRPVADGAGPRSESRSGVSADELRYPGWRVLAWLVAVPASAEPSQPGCTVSLRYGCLVWDGGSGGILLTYTPRAVRLFVRLCGIFRLRAPRVAGLPMCSIGRPIECG